VSEVMLSIKEA